MSYEGEYGLASTRAKVLRVTWKPTLTPPQYQTPAVNNVGEVITFTDVTDASDHIDVTEATGEFLVLKKLKTATFLIAAQIARGNGGGTDEWGIYFELFNGTDWIIVPDSTRYFTFRSNEDGNIQHLAYDLAVNDLTEGTRFRLKQICSDAYDTLGLLTSKPFVDAPTSAGIIVSVQTVG